MQNNYPNAFDSDQVRALQCVYSRVLAIVFDGNAESKIDLAKLIFALAADGGANDSHEIDVEQMSAEACAFYERLGHRNASLQPSQRPAEWMWKTAEFAY